MSTFPRTHKHKRKPIDHGTYIEGRIRKHRFEGNNPSFCTRKGCGKAFASVIHK